MKFIDWIILIFLKTYSFDLLLSIVCNGLILFIELYLVTKLSFIESYEIKPFMPPRHLKKNTISHIGGIILISNFLIQYCLLNINNIIYLFNYQFINETLTKYSEMDNINLFLMKNKTIVINLLSHYLNNIGFVVSIKVLFLGIYFNHKNLINQTACKILLYLPLISFIVNWIFSYQIILLNYKLFSVKIFNKTMLSKQFLSYGPILKLGPTFIYNVILLILMYILFFYYRKKFLWKQDSHIKDYKKYLLGGLAMTTISFLAVNGYSIWEIWQQKIIYMINDKLDPIFTRSILFLYHEHYSMSIILFLFPLIFGVIDDVEKINKKIIQMAYGVKFMIFSLFGLAAYNYYNYNYCFSFNLLKYLCVWFVGKNLWLYFIGPLWQSFLFNSIINSINFTDGADGLLFISLIGFFTGLIVLTINDCFTLLNKKILSTVMITWNIYILLLLIIFVIFFSIFFYFNRKPAKIMLGETGSFGIGVIVFFFMMTTYKDLLLFLGFIMGFVQLFSTTIQIFSSKIFKKKIFLLAPFHHHLELLGYSDKFILILYGLINLLGVILGILIYLFYPPYNLLMFIFLKLV